MNYPAGPIMAQEPSLLLALPGIKILASNNQHLSSKSTITAFPHAKLSQIPYKSPQRTHHPTVNPHNPHQGQPSPQQLIRIVYKLVNFS